MLRFRLGGLVLAGAMATALAAATTLAQAPAVSLLLTDLWTTATPPGAATAGGYLTIANSGPEGDRLVAASSSLAATVILHQMELRDGIASMRPLDAIDIPAGTRVVLGPAGLHLMFTGLRQPLRAGDDLPVTLTFARVGPIETYLHVLPIGTRSPNSGPGI
jgi:copper(I)-binding protein